MALLTEANIAEYERLNEAADTQSQLDDDQLSTRSSSIATSSFATAPPTEPSSDLLTESESGLPVHQHKAFATLVRDFDGIQTWDEEQQSAAILCHLDDARHALHIGMTGNIGLGSS